MAEFSARPADRIRQAVVTIVAVLAIAGAAVGSGAFGGTPIQNAAGGALSATATVVAPAVPAFSIWSVIYTGLVVFTIRQLLPGQATSPRQRLLGYPVALSLLLNAAWILVVQAGWLAASVVVIVVLLAVLAWAFVVCLRVPGHGWVEAVMVDGVVGLYLGWVCVAAVANIAAVLVAAGFDGWGLPADVWAVIVLAAVTAIGVALAVRGRGRIAPALSLCWGLAWVAVARAASTPHSLTVAVAAGVAAVVIALATIICRVAAVRALDNGRVRTDGIGRESATEHAT